MSLGLLSGPLGIGWGVGPRGSDASVRVNRSNTLDADAVFRGQTLDAHPVQPRLRIWNNDPVSAELVGRYRAGGPSMSLVDTTFANIFTMARASTATDFDASGVLVSQSAGVIRQGYDPATKLPLGWLLEGSAVNSIPNPRAEGGNASTLPSGWFAGGVAGVTLAYATGTEYGLPYLDVTASGTPSANGSISILFVSGNATAAATGQTWTASVYHRLVGGSLSGLLVPNLGLAENTAGGVFVTGAAVTQAVPTATLARCATTRTLSGGGTVGAVQSSYSIAGVASGTPVAFTVRLYAPQLEQNYFASSVILPPVSSPAATTRAADALSIDGARFTQIFGTGKSVTNLATYSQDGTNAAWGKSAASVTISGTAPDGSATANVLLPDTTNAPHSVSMPGVAFASGSTYSLSFYAKANGYSYVHCRLPGASFPASIRAANFNLATGAVEFADAGLVVNIAAVGAGWYRCSIVQTATASSTGGALVGVNNAAGGGQQTFAGTGTDSILIWGAQLETTPATPAANLMTAPETYVGIAWARVAATVTAGAATAPDGGLAEKLAEDATNAGHYIGAVANWVAGQPYTLAVYAKGIERTAVQLLMPSIGTANGLVVGNFDLTGAGQASAAGGGVATIAAVPNATGWYRCTLALASASQSVAGGPQIRILNTYATASASAASYAGTAGNGLALWGVQLVQASSAPAYVPNSALVSGYVPTVASAVTKSGISECAVILECMASLLPPGGATQYLCDLSDGTASNRVGFRFPSTGIPAAVVVQLGSASATQPQASGAVVAGTAFRVGLRLTNAGGFPGISVCINGSAIQTGVVPLPTFLNTLTIGNLTTGSTPLNGRVRLVRALAYAPSDAELISRSTLGA